ncbi:MAG: SRPBCC family protein [Solirubrobacterales bacterium]
MPSTTREVEVRARPGEVFRFLGDPSNLVRWWPRVVRVEAVEGQSGEEGLIWTNVVEADSGRRLRLDYRMVDSDRASRLCWEHLLEGTAFSGHLVRQAVEVELSDAPEGTRVAVTAIGELKGAARLAGPSLKSDQKKLLDEALGRLSEALEEAP